MSTVFNIPESNLEALTIRLEKLTRRAKKLGKPTPILTKVGEHEEVVDKKKGLVRKYIEVTIDSVPVCVNSWDFIAKIELGDSEVGLIIYRVPDVLPDIDIPLEYRQTTNYCSHCNKSVWRNNVYVLRHQVTNQWMQVGTQCLGQFLGGVNPEDVVKNMECLIDFDAICLGAQDPNFFGFGSGAIHLDLEQTLTFTAFVIKSAGWLSRSKARELSQQDEYKTATADLVNSAYFTPERDQSEKVKALVREFDEITQEEKDKFTSQVEAALAWIRSTDDEQNSDYYHNLLICCSGETFNKKHMGIVASLLVAYQNTMGRLEELKAKQNKALTLTHLGTVGKRETFHVTVKRLHEMQSQWGSKVGIFMEDKSGNRLTWWATSNPDVEIGTSYEIVAGVKSHDTYQNAPTTTITRAKIVGCIGSIGGIS